MWEFLLHLNVLGLVGAGHGAADPGGVRRRWLPAVGMVMAAAAGGSVDQVPRSQPLGLDTGNCPCLAVLAILTAVFWWKRQRSSCRKCQRPAGVERVAVHELVGRTFRGASGDCGGPRQGQGRRQRVDGHRCRTPPWALRCAWLGKTDGVLLKRRNCALVR
jgi:hypothetical protein